MIQFGLIRKEYLLLGASVVMVIICYQLSFKKTIEAWHQHRQLAAQLARSANVSFQPGYTERKNANISRVLGLYKADTAGFRSNIISRISFIAEKENVKLSEVPAEDPVGSNTKVIIHKLAFEGDFFSLLRTLNELQKTDGIGIIRNVDLKSVEEHFNGTDSKKLVLTIQLTAHV